MTDSYVSGRDSFIMMAKQSAEGTVPTSYNMSLPISQKPGLFPKDQRTYLQEFRGGESEKTSFVRTGVETTGDLMVTAYPSGGLEHILDWIFGDTTSAQVDTTDAYSHAFAYASELPYMAMAYDIADLPYHKFYDCLAQSVKLSLKPDAQVDVTTTVLGRYGGLTQTPPTPSYTTENGLHGMGVEVSLDSAANTDIFSLDITIDRKVVNKKTFNRSQGLEGGVRKSIGIDITGSMGILFQDYEHLEYYFGAAGATNFTNDYHLEDEMARALSFNARGQKIVTTPTVHYDEFGMNLPEIVYSGATIDTPYDDLVAYQIDFDVLNAVDATATVKSLLHAVAVPS